MPILHEILLDHGHLMVVHDAYVADQTRFTRFFIYLFFTSGLSTMRLTCIMIFLQGSQVKSLVFLTNGYERFGFLMYHSF